MRAAGLLLVLAGGWLISQTVLANPSLLDVMGIT